MEVIRHRWQQGSPHARLLVTACGRRRAAPPQTHGEHRDQRGRSWRLTRWLANGNVRDVKRTPLSESIERRLGRPLVDFVDEQRGRGASWRRIALSISGLTGIEVTGEALRQWHAAARPADAPAVAS